MREIEFRGKRADNSGEWVYGYYYHDQRFKNGYPCQDVYIIRNELDLNYEVGPATVGQYTGLKDKNGEKIYEGDILDFGGGRILIVVFNRGRFAVQFRDGSIEDNWLRPSHFPVIGNVHDNPELLEGR